MIFYIKAFAVILLLIIGTNPLMAYNRSDLSGQITFSDGSPVVNAVVGIVEIQKANVTDNNGNYTIKDVPYGQYHLDVSTIEAMPKRISIDCQKTKINLSVKLERRESIISDAVVVTAKSAAGLLKARGYTVGVVDTKKISLSSISASELLDRSAGINLRQNGGMGSDIQYNINGLSGNSIRMFIDGVPIRSYGSSFSLSSIPSSMIERIEVYKGVVPAHLAEDALGGAVNIVLKQASVNNLSTSYSYGSFNTHKWDINGDYRNKKTGLTFGSSAFYNYTDNNYKVWGDNVYYEGSGDDLGGINKIVAERFHDSYESYGINANIGYTGKKWADRLILDVLYSDMKKDIQHGATMQVVYGHRKAIQNTKMANLRYVKHDIVKNLDVTASGSYSYGQDGIIDTVPYKYNWLGNIILDQNGNPRPSSNGTGEAGHATLATDLNENVTGRMSLTYEFVPKHKIYANAFYNSFTRNTEDVMMPQFEQDLSNTRTLSKKIFGLSYEGNIFDDKLQLSLFYKYYIQSVNLIDPTLDEDKQLYPESFKSNTQDNGYGGAISYRVIPEILFTFSGEKALRMPANSEILGNPAGNVNPTYNLRPEKSTNLNLGTTIGPFNMGLHNLMIDVNFFYRDITDMIHKSLPTGTVIEYYNYENLGKVLSKGVDIDLKYNYHNKIYWSINCSNFDARYDPQYADGSGNPERLSNTPYLTLNNSLGYVKNDLFKRGARFSIDYNIGYVHEFFRNSEVLGGTGKAVIPTQLVHDIGCVYTFSNKKISLGFDVSNLTNEQVFDNWGLQKPGRAFFGKISYNIF